MQEAVIVLPLCCSPRRHRAPPTCAPLRMCPRGLSTGRASAVAEVACTPAPHAWRCMRIPYQRPSSCCSQSTSKCMPCASQHLQLCLKSSTAVSIKRDAGAIECATVSRMPGVHRGFGSTNLHYHSVRRRHHARHLHQQLQSSAYRPAQWQLLRERALCSHVDGLCSSNTNVW